MILLDGVYPSKEHADAFDAATKAKRTSAEAAALEHWSDPAQVKADPEKANLEQWRAFVPSLFHNHAAGEKFASEFQPTWTNSAVGDLMGADPAAMDPITARVKGSTIPVLILQGQQDPIGTSAVAYAALLPNATIVMIPDAGHNPWLEQPKAFESALLGFLKEKGL